ncbi:hypothetical protein SK128_005597 [Halocaridina rubra]|uniref:3CxxC-type domain-containing protein n=1 Tax=Halocaridina rubra TaxID=373956 RepID=A0AAN8ZVB9_HALRR
MPVKSDATEPELFGMITPAVHEIAAEDKPTPVWWYPIVPNDQESINKNPEVSNEGRGQHSDTGTTRKEVNPTKKTPYQGSRRACGRFHCDECDREWFSPNSWANCYQRCRECNGQVYPNAQFPLEKCKRSKNIISSHLSDLCQMCQKQGYQCASKLADPGNSVVSGIPTMISARGD